MSGGPRTPAGKARSRGNAMKHGLSASTASTVLLQDEDAGAEEVLAQELRRDLDPRDALQRALVERVIGLLRRLRRVDRFEAAVISEHRDDGASVGLALLRDVPRCGLSTVLRHEAGIQRSLARTLQLLREARTARRGRSTSGSPSSVPGKIT